MKKSKLGIAILMFMLLLLVSGCKKSDIEDIKGLSATPSPSSASTTSPTITPTAEPSTEQTTEPITVPIVTPTITPSHTPNELSLDAYEKFINNEAKVSFDRFRPKNDMEEALYNKGNEYTLSEVLDKVTASYLINSENKKVQSIDYSYIDCGKDGVNELLLRFHGMGIYGMEDDSTLVYVIKYIDQKLSLCYCYETWARSEATMNEYGYYQSSGSGGASNHIAEYGLIDKDGTWQFIVSIESELDINQLTWSEKLGQLPAVAEEKGITGGIELDTIRLDDSESAVSPNESGNNECFYTFYVYDDNQELVKDAHLYTDSIYKEIFDEASVLFITPEDVSKMIFEKEKKVGATAEIKEGAEITWKALDGNLFSDYVES